MIRKKFKPAFDGVIAGLNHRSIRLQFILAALAVTAGMILKLTSGEWIAVLLCIGLVISAEIMNTAIEFICDYLTQENDPRIKTIKDLAAGSVLCASAAALVTALIILARHL